MSDRRPLGKRQATRNAKLAVLDMLQQVAGEAMTEATWADSRQDHADLVTQALANSALRESLARHWRVVV